MVDMTLKTPLPQVLMNDVLTALSVWPNHTLMVGNTPVTKTFIKYAAEDQKTAFSKIDGKPCTEVWYAPETGIYYYPVGGNRFKEASDKSFLLGDSALKASISVVDNLFDPVAQKIIAHSAGQLVFSTDTPNFMVGGVWVKAVFIAMQDEPELGNKFGEMWRQTASGAYVKIITDYTITYSDNPPTGAIDLSQTIQKPGFQLSIFPNPVLDSATISFVLPRDDAVSVLVYNALGQQVSSPLQQQNLPAGKQQVALDTHEFPAGMYIARIEGQSCELQVVKFIVER